MRLVPKGRNEKVDKELKMNITRRSFVGCGAMSALAGCRCPFICGDCDRSNYDGVRIGAITYSFRTMKSGALNVLGYAVKAGLGSVELMCNDAESFAGISNSWPKTPEERAKVLKERLAVPESKWKELRRLYEDAGVKVRILKFGSIGGKTISGEENDYYCRVAHLLGATAITREVPFGNAQVPPGPGVMPDENLFGEIGRNCADIADRNGIDIAFHNHLQINSVSYDSKLLGYSKRLKINFDIGHYTAANDDDPLAMVRKYRDRIVSIHVKDRTRAVRGRKNLPFGCGDTPLTGLMALLKREGWEIPCDIELEYAIPAGSDAVKEVGVCRNYCRNAVEAC